MQGNAKSLSKDAHYVGYLGQLIGSWVYIHPFEVSTNPWKSTSMDLLGGLSKTSHAYGYVMVVVDRLNKR